MLALRDRFELIQFDSIDQDLMFCIFLLLYFPPLSPNPFPPPPGRKWEPTPIFGRVFEGGTFISTVLTIGR